MRHFLIVFLSIAFVSTVSSQTNIAGVINIYASATAYDECSNQLSVIDATGFQDSMKVIIIQMQGATINTADNSSFGDIIDMGQVGTYEVAKILSVNGNDMVFDHILVNTYNFDGKVQVVSMPVYESVLAGTLTADTWNGETGGVFAIEVTGEMIINAAGIDVSGKGFRGGVAQIGGGSNDCNALTFANDYVYGLNNWRGASKGEGIAIINSGQEAGRGAQANGGGGGNDHNSGGGGGGNVATGGQGGENNEPSFFGCSGNFPGKGSKGIAQNSGIFMGGGGGAGHENNNVGTDGGAGGGIIFVVANTFHGLGSSLKANGLDAVTTFGDGGGGGGGGGSILFIVQNATGAHFEVEGGKGADANNGNADRCQGPGGGGGGGRVFSPADIPVLPLGLSGGDAGMSINSSECSDSSNGATNGENGSLETLDSLLTGNVPFLPTEIMEQIVLLELCQGDSALLTMEFTGFDLNYQWQINGGSGFENISNIPPFSGANTEELNIADIPTELHGQQIQLVLSNDCFAPVTSEPILLQILPAAMANFSFTQNDLTANFTNLSTNSTTYNWNFGDTESATTENPIHNYADIGTYVVELITANACGQDTFTTAITFIAPIMAAFSYEDVTGCAPFEVQFNNQSTGSFDELFWEFPGGTPSTSMATSPVVFYDTPGQYDVTLTASNINISQTHSETNLVEILTVPSPSFSWELLDPLVVSFTNTSQNATTYFWNFGDTQISMETNPIHEYAVPGDYEVTLNAQNPFCGVSGSQTVFLITAVNDINLSGLTFFPNPVNDIFYIKQAQKSHFSIEILTIEGRRVFQKACFGDTELDFSHFMNGVYFVKYKSDDNEVVVKVVKM